MDRTALQSWTSRHKTARALALRARIVLACAEPSTTNRAVAAALGVSPLTVAKWRRRFAEDGHRRRAPLTTAARQFFRRVVKIPAPRMRSDTCAVGGPQPMPRGLCPRKAHAFVGCRRTRALAADGLKNASTPRSRKDASRFML
ncbi:MULTISPECIES: helix-turn-helix domain-containing protein [Comamonadaceae]|uniref:helix-turn-helix domain-containing protein n=1 Tax=Acidovorax sacchari TaxID=3230736 RepID=UPI0034A1E5C1